MSDIHPHDLSKALKDLVTRGFLQSAGATRAMVYTFPKPGLPESDATVQTRLDGIAEQKDGISVHLGKDSVHLEDISVHLTSGNSKKNKISNAHLTFFRRRWIPRLYCLTTKRGGETRPNG